MMMHKTTFDINHLQLWHDIHTISSSSSISSLFKFLPCFLAICGVSRECVGEYNWDFTKRSEIRGGLTWVPIKMR